ncbi:MAG: helix-turn-helix transcriptional regulator [bacterium]|nr:helix-turn-helix transcriptional regulator [bacterium]
MATSWILLLATGIVIGISLAGLILLARERRHRARVHQLMERLQELERMGVSLAESEHQEPPQELSAVTPHPRGWLSSVVSSLMRKVEVETSGPQRLDLRAVAYVNDHLDETISIPAIATHLCASPRTLQRQLATNLGCSPTELVVAVKMRMAKQLLQEEGALVQNVAQAVGYDDPYHFSRRFRAYYGVPPSQLSGH